MLFSWDCIPDFIINYNIDLNIGAYVWILKETSMYVYATEFPPPDVDISSCQMHRFSLLFSLHNDLLFVLITICQCLQKWSFKTEVRYLLWYLLTTIPGQYHTVSFKQVRVILPNDTQTVLSEKLSISIRLQWTRQCWVFY